ncbi:GrpE protein [Kibdelosporangium aridum]|uniref:GrpE protein n=1 Tax=Kibdelosporangium aridum TaxID=2030 RepID=A0A1Y5XJG1_KIBAR|nr:GrpE protein [Kibdelosporangium aridum]
MISLASLFRRTKADDETDPTIEVSAEVIAGIDQSETLKQALAERDSLVQLCLYALDRARSPGVVERIEEGLAGIGVAAIRPDGDLFDPARHEAGGTVPTQDLTMDGVVAETEVVGFADRGRLLRAPIVTVYKARQP